MGIILLDRVTSQLNESRGRRKESQTANSLRNRSGLRDPKRHLDSFAIVCERGKCYGIKRQESDVE